MPVLQAVKRASNARCFFAA